VVRALSATAARPWSGPQALLALLLVSFAQPALAVDEFYGAMSGDLVVSPVETPATGTVFLSADVSTLGVELSFTSLQGTSTAAHIHCCAAYPTNIGVAVFFSDFLSA
jgi:hypothetical protein